MAYVCTGSRESEGPYARRIGTQRIGVAGGDLRERKTRHESVPHGSCCAPVFAYRRYEWCGQMDKVSAPLPKAITFSCVRVPASKAAPSFLVWPALPVQAAGVWHCTESVRLQSLERRGDLHPTRDARARKLDGMAARRSWRGAAEGCAPPRKNSYGWSGTAAPTSTFRPPLPHIQSLCFLRPFLLRARHMLAGMLMWPRS
jgi:hypothetical protein